MKVFILVLVFLKSLHFTVLQEAISDNDESEYIISRRNQPGFLFSMPKTLLFGKNETVCLSTHHTTTPTAKAIIDLKLKEKHFFTSITLNSSVDHMCFELNVPPNFGHQKDEPQFVNVRVQMQLNGIVYSAHNQDPILIYPRRAVTFLETDRGMYRSGDRIKIRILTLSHDLLPPKDYKISEVKLKNPLDITVVVWQNVSCELGLAHLEHQMSQDSLVGKWKLECNGELKTFDVSNYILPRFQVDLHYSKMIYIDSPTFDVKVCSKYTYGRPVNKGTASITVTDSHHIIQKLERNKELSLEGCATFTFTRNQLYLYEMKSKFIMYDPRIHVHLTATVTEYGTDRTESASGKSLVALQPYKMTFRTDQSFLPGLLYSGKLQFKNVYVDLADEIVEICYNVAIKRSWNYLKTDQCTNFTVGNDNVVQFHVLPLKSSVIHLHLNARSVNHTNIGDSFLAVRLYSISNSYIYLEQNNPDNTKCRSVNQFTVQYTTDKLTEHENLTFYYMIKTRGEIYKLQTYIHSVRKHYPNYLNDFTDYVGEKHKYVKLGAAIDRFVLKFRLDDKLNTNYELLVYYITSAGETVAATKQVHVESCLNNKVQANWSTKQAIPGELATLSVRASSNSLCSISAVDKSTKLLTGGNSEWLNTISFLRPFLNEREIAPSNRKSCIVPVKRNKPAGYTLDGDNNRSDDDSMWDLRRRRRKRYVYSFSEDFDSYDTFNKFGTITITNLKMVTKPCYTGPVLSPNNSVQFLTDTKYNDQNYEQYAPIRSDFPDTWLWELIPIRAGNLTSVRRYLPHTITNWVTNVLCVSSSEGVGFSDTFELTGFQPFFIEVLAPYSIKRGETLYLHVILFNYLNYSLPIRLGLGESHGLKLVDLRQQSRTYCVLGNQTVTHVFELKGTEIGKVNLTISAELDSSYPGHCGPDVVVNKRDVVVKTLLVEPEGFPIKLTKSALMCASLSDDQTPSNNISWDASVPKDVVFNTAKTKIVLNGDLLGETIENLDKLVTMPTGCGEQIMATLAPNLFILKYLNATGNLMPSVRQRIMKNLKIGYQRILNYIHKDGSFSAFGYHESTGSMFLTAFVVRTLKQAKKYVYVDQKIIDKAVAWIYSKQLENGCFSTMLHVFQDMGGATTENSTAALTSYVMISLLDAGIDVPESVETNAKYCIRGHYHLDKYTLAISAYALFKVNWANEANRTLSKLLQLAEHQNGMMWWSTSKDNHSSIATDIEITSYVLLSLLHYGTNEYLAYAHSIVRWLSTKRGPHGGFQSTQDTVVGLDALTKYSDYIVSRQLNLDVKVEAFKHHTQNIKIRRDDVLKSKKLTLKEPNNNNVKISVTGHGCVLVQMVQSYYLHTPPYSDAFTLNMEIAPVSTIDQCSIAALTPCLAYNGPNLQSSMAVLEVNLPSGYEADRASLYHLVDNPERNSKVKRFEEMNNRVVLYFTKLGQQQVCITFKINEHSVVAAKSDSVVKLYDYYQPEREVIQFYKMSSKCDLNENLAIMIPASSTTVHEAITTSSSPASAIARLRREITTPENVEEVIGNFVDKDMELDVPKGMESNVPVYTLPDLRLNETVGNRIKS